MMHGNVRFLPECAKVFQRELDRMFYQTTNLQSEILKSIRRELLPFVGGWHLSIRPKEWGNVRVSISLGGLKAAQHIRVKQAGDRFVGMLHRTRTFPCDQVKEGPGKYNEANSHQT